MRFTWDEQKKAGNLANHGVSFERAALVFSDPRAVTSCTHYSPPTTHFLFPV
jgi:uncharacterized DUF497 family protein